MKSVLITFSIWLVLFNQAIGQNLEVQGMAKISEMDIDNTADSVVVTLSDGTLAIRDASTLVQYQLLSISNDTVYLTNGGFVKLPFDGTWENLSGIPANVDHIRYTDAEAISAVTNAGLFLTDEVDGSITNEIQNLTEVLTQDSSAANKRIKDLKDPLDAQDAATKRYVDALEAQVTLMNSILLDAGYSGTVKDIDGNIYKTLKIGNQIWMTENLRTQNYNDGTPIPLVIDSMIPDGWAGLTAPGYCWYANDSAMYASPHGALYNYYVVADTNSHNVCPVGWHVPSDIEWTSLTDYLTNNGFGHGGNGSDIAKSMASHFWLAGD